MWSGAVQDEVCHYRLHGGVWLHWYLQSLSWVDVPKFRPEGGSGKLFSRPVNLVPKVCLHTETSGVRIARPGGIKQVEIPFDRIPQFVLRVAAVAAVYPPPAPIPVLVVDLAKMGQRRA